MERPSPLGARALHALMAGAGPLSEAEFESALATPDTLSLLVAQPSLDAARRLRVAEVALGALRWSHSRDAATALARLWAQGDLAIGAGVGQTLLRLATGEAPGASGQGARRIARALVLDAPDMTPAVLADIARTLPGLDADWGRVVRHAACTPAIWRTALERDTVGTVLDLVSTLDAAMVHPTVRSAVAAHPASLRSHKIAALRGAQGSEFAAGWRAYARTDPVLARQLWSLVGPAQRRALSAGDGADAEQLLQSAPSAGRAQ